MSKKKNRSAIYKDGMRVQTRDEYLDRTEYYSPGHPNKNDLYRGTYIVDSNSNDELVLVKMTTHRGKSPKGTVSEFINVYDNKGNPIKIDKLHFRIAKRGNLDGKSVGKLKKKIFQESKRSLTNRKLVHEKVKKR